MENRRMKLIYVCPNCGTDLEGGELLANPPVPFVRCPECGFIWYGKMNFEEMRIPFAPPIQYDWNASGEDIPACCRRCNNHPSNGGSGVCLCALPYFTNGGVTC